jgi:predicted aminopeptidase
VKAAPEPSARGGRTVPALLAALLCLLLPGCSTLGYYWQAVIGQWRVQDAARPLEEVLAAPGTDATLRARLETARALRAFASGELALPDNGSYRRYADLKRPFVVWNVFAAPEFSIEPRQWCFPVAGCVTYKGWVDRAAAERFAAQLAGEGLDVFVYGVPAYSTLGWFDDPLLNTFIHYPRAELARLVFHELAHQVVYAPGDSTFNESFATAVEMDGVRRWLARSGTPTEAVEFEAMQARRADFLALVERTRAGLAALYAQLLAPEDMRARKAEALARMRAEYARLRQGWGGFAGYDRWFAEALGNAHLASVAVYTQQVPAFEALLARCGGEPARFHAAAKRLAALSPERREAALAALVAGAGPGCEPGGTASGPSLPGPAHSLHRVRPMASPVLLASESAP